MGKICSILYYVDITNDVKFNISSLILYLEIRKVLSKVAKEKGYEELADWIKPCLNHLHWSAMSTYVVRELGRETYVFVQPIPQ